MAEKVVARNRKASHDYVLKEKYEAGLALMGSEIKSIRAGQVSLKEAYVRTNGREAFLVNAHIAPYNQAGKDGHEPLRERKLLLHADEIADLYEEVKRNGSTIVPLQIYLKKGRAKLEISVAKGKKKWDKRQDIAKRDAEREMARAMKNRD
ncbi:MAG: SsrA-binding protein SmpB [Anaerolineales bacterium]|nr:MAG: SsrA-binding protein SmpB [Anaerolineales bacterium]